ncbi:hypothetical protein IV37_GL000857 [Fructilactobacillus fructivorans]|uniref:hypothetical protein n=1 Tax=Fructilactobacillus fructivorans TaxID=1614 RepID=UPI000704D6E6|nr:hypothetical protein [Fructilactobacillus fructivorans]KRN13215.1 hypothetical protein IV37_GL000857 [Fructilactobacillus fructivorans]
MPEKSDYIKDYQEYLHKYHIMSRLLLPSIILVIITFTLGFILLNMHANKFILWIMGTIDGITFSLFITALGTTIRLIIEKYKIKHMRASRLKHYYCLWVIILFVCFGTFVFIGSIEILLLSNNLWEAYESPMLPTFLVCSGFLFYYLSKSTLKYRKKKYSKELTEGIKKMKLENK